MYFALCSFPPTAETGHPSVTPSKNYRITKWIMSDDKTIPGDRIPGARQSDAIVPGVAGSELYAESGKGLAGGFPAGPFANNTVVENILEKMDLDPSNFVVTELGAEEVIPSKGPRVSEGEEIFSNPVAPEINKFKKRRRPDSSPEEKKNNEDSRDFDEEVAKSTHRRRQRIVVSEKRRDITMESVNLTKDSPSSKTEYSEKKTKALSAPNMAALLETSRL